MDKLDIDPVKQEIISETSKIAWQELQYFFASGKAVYVSEKLDLVEVASCFANDNKVMVENWMNNKQIMLVENDQARNWYDNDAIVWAVVVKPWVLVQPIV